MSAFEVAETFTTVNLLRDGPAAIIELNRPDSLNAWTLPMGLELREAVARCAADDEVRAVMLVGAGRGFSAGADLTAFGSDEIPKTDSGSGRPDLGWVLRDRYNPLMRDVRALRKPVLAAVDGPAAGIGMSLALAADIVIASDRARLIHAFTKIGLGPDGGASLFLLARVGWTRAAGIMFGGRAVDAAEALEIGLVNRVLPAEGFRAAAEDEIRRLAAGPTVAYDAIKRAINLQIGRHLDELLELEASEQTRMGETDDFVAAATAFIQKQDPVYTGR
ncbi:MAG: enoyl-CoA hydratase-related protein [Solirubrobacteraceae bacterium]|nr:enoyl-CoA hydratase-related protein [Solirubrobacteraceae bacterium]